MPRSKYFPSEKQEQILSTCQKIIFALAIAKLIYRGHQVFRHFLTDPKEYDTKLCYFLLKMVASEINALEPFRLFNLYYLHGVSRMNLPYTSMFLYFVTFLITTPLYVTKRHTAHLCCRHNTERDELNRPEITLRKRSKISTYCEFENFFN